MPARSAAEPGRLHACVVAALVAASGPPAAAAVLNVPAKYATVQAAINAAAIGDTVLLAPGVHTGRPTIPGKAITLASQYLTTGDRSLVERTILDGTAGGWALRVLPGGDAPTIVGITIRNADDGIRATGKFRLFDSRVTGTGDGIDYEDGSGGIVSGCLMYGNTDDAIDSDHGVNAIIVGNTLRDNGDDGIEIRLQAYSGPRLTIVIRDNLIMGNGEDGIQLISYNLDTPRTIRIERNLILNNAMAGVGMMCCENTIENYQGADLKETVGLYNNTIVDNNHGVTGGDSLIALNNLIMNCTNVGLKRADAGSIAAHNLFYGNGTDHTGSNVDLATTLYADPFLGPDYGLTSGSPAIDAGCSRFEHLGRVIWKMALEGFEGVAPDLGAMESPATLGVGDDPYGIADALQAVPEPSRGTTVLRFSLPAAGPARLDILDVAGRRVRRLVDGARSAGRHEVAWDGTDSTGRLVPAGAYFARLDCATHVRTRRFVRLD